MAQYWATIGLMSEVYWVPGENIIYAQQTQNVNPVLD